MYSLWNIGMEEYYYVVPTQIFLCLDAGVNVAQIANAESDIRGKKDITLNKVSHRTVCCKMRLCYKTWDTAQLQTDEFSVNPNHLRNYSKCLSVYGSTVVIHNYNHYKKKWQILQMTGFNSDLHAAINVQLPRRASRWLIGKCAEVLCNGGCWHSECATAQISLLALGTFARLYRGLDFEKSSRSLFLKNVHAVPCQSEVRAYANMHAHTS